MSYAVGELSLQSGIRPFGLFDFFLQASDVSNRSTATGKFFYNIGQSVDVKGKGFRRQLGCTVRICVCIYVGMDRWMGGGGDEAV